MQGQVSLIQQLRFVATTAVRSLTRTCRIWRSDASGEAKGRWGCEWCVAVGLLRTER